MKLAPIFAAALSSMFVLSANAASPPSYTDDSPIQTYTQSGRAFYATNPSQQSCLGVNDTGWEWFNYSSSGTCNLQTLAVQTSVPPTNHMWVAGSCPGLTTLAYCQAKEIDFKTGNVVQTSFNDGSGGVFDLEMGFPNLPSPYDNVLINCTLPPGCRLWRVYSGR